MANKTKAVVAFTPQTSLANVEDAFGAFEQDKPAVTGGAAFLKLRKNDGLWVYGQEEIECEDGARWLLDSTSLCQGYIDWHQGRPAGERMAVLGQPPVNPADLPPAQGKNGWEKQVGFGVICLDGEDKGVQIVYKTNTDGGKRAYNAVFDAIKARALAQLPRNPIIFLKEDSYTHAEYGKIFKPVFEIVGWVDQDGNEFGLEEVPQIQQGEAEAEPVEEEAKPAGRQRRQRRA